MSDAICEHIRKYPDFYVDDKPAIVRGLPSKDNLLMLRETSEGYSYFFPMNQDFDYKVIFFIPEEEDLFNENAKVFMIRFSDKGYAKFAEVHNIDPKAKYIKELGDF